MPREHTAPAAFTDKPYTHIHMTPVESNQVGAVGYDPATKTLAALGFPHVATDKSAKLYRAADRPAIYAAMVAHIEAVQAKQAA